MHPLPSQLPNQYIASEVLSSFQAPNRQRPSSPCLCTCSLSPSVPNHSMPSQTDRLSHAPCSVAPATPSPPPLSEAARVGLRNVRCTTRPPGSRCLTSASGHPWRWLASGHATVVPLACFRSRHGPGPVRVSSERFAVGSAKFFASPVLHQSLPDSWLDRLGGSSRCWVLTPDRKKQGHDCPCRSKDCRELKLLRLVDLTLVTSRGGWWVPTALGRSVRAAARSLACRLLSLWSRVSLLGLPYPRVKFANLACVAYLTCRAWWLPLGAGELNVWVRRRRLRIPLFPVHRRSAVELLIARLDQTMSLDTGQRRCTKRRRGKADLESIPPRKALVARRARKGLRGHVDPLVPLQVVVPAEALGAEVALEGAVLLRRLAPNRVLGHGKLVVVLGPGRGRIQRVAEGWRRGPCREAGERETGRRPRDETGVGHGEVAVGSPGRVGW